MGLFDFLGGGTPAEKAQRLKKKVTEKYGDAANRQGAIEDLGKQGTPEAVAVLIQRYTLNVEPQTTDTEEKARVQELILGIGAKAVAPVKDFLGRSDQASSWALRLLEGLLTEPEVVALSVELLTRLGTSYSRDPERKLVLLQYLEDKVDPAIGPATLPLLEDIADDVKLAALKTLAAHPEASAQAAVLKLLGDADTAKRVQTRCLQFLAEAAQPIADRKALEPLLGEGWVLDKGGLLKKKA